MQVDICTLFEGDYHFGVAALANSLAVNGFKGRIWVGHRGAFPSWAVDTHAREGYTQTNISPDIQIRFIALESAWLLAHAKPQFMLDLFERHSEIAALMYFDPDIVVKCEWEFFEHWASCGVALCADLNASMPQSHPLRFYWRAWAAQQGIPVERNFDTYFNSGFLSVSRDQTEILTRWHLAIEKMGAGGVDLRRFGYGSGKRTNPFHQTDQDALNIAAMTTTVPLSFMGPEGMDFVPGGYTMSHAAGVTKPWRKAFLKEALGGRPPNKADRGYLDNALYPIALYSHGAVRLKKIELALAAAIGRFIRRS
jgi:hypothetical protein